MPAGPASRIPAAALALAALAAGAYACDDSTAPAAGPRRVYGDPVAVGAGRARSYVVLGDAPGAAPLEIGVALTEGALDALPAAAAPHHGGGDAHAHADPREHLLPLPSENPTGYRLVELNWNPGGHEPPGVYDVPHFDFHFYTVTKAERDAIDPAALGPAAYAARSANLPPAAQVPAAYAALAAPGTPPVAVPRMGVHWSDLTAPELQGMLGRPDRAAPFTTTFIHGSWDGRFIFAEPMVTRAFLLARKAAATPAGRDSVMALTAAASYAAPGYRPAAYRVAYDPAAREYRVALTQLTAHP
jgi:hypothetical protein